MRLVRIAHPVAGVAYQPASALPHWRARGWEEAPEPEPAPTPTPDEGDEPAGEQAGKEQDSKPSKTRRRSTKGDED